MQPVRLSYALLSNEGAAVPRVSCRGGVLPAAEQLPLPISEGPWTLHRSRNREALFEVNPLTRFAAASVTGFGVARASRPRSLC